MSRYSIEQKFKSVAAFLIILVLFPYIVSVFVNGADFRKNEDDIFYIQVRVSDTEEADGIIEINWTDYLAGILALEMPGDYELEALKAQAVVVRTQIYRSMENSADEEKSADKEDASDKVLDGEFLTREDMQDKWGAQKGNSYYEKYVRAVEETDDTVLMYGDTCAWTPFHQSSNGMTRSAEEVVGSQDFPYVAVRECPLDKEADEEIQIFRFFV